MSPYHPRSRIDPAPSGNPVSSRSGNRILARAREIVGDPPAPFRGEIEAWEDRFGAACLALVERMRGMSRDPVAAARAELRRQRALARKEAQLLPSVTGDDLADE